MSDFNGILATQTDHFRGTSTIDIGHITPNFRAIQGARYIATVSGGVSGAFSVEVVGSLGGREVVLCGLSNLVAAGDYLLYPRIGDVGGDFLDLETPVGTSQQTYDQLVPPSKVVFRPGDPVDGISASIVVGACILGPD